MDVFVQRMSDLRIGDKYQLNHFLGSGTFGQVWLGRNVDTNDEVAIKLEHHTMDPSMLRDEVAVYRAVQKRTGFPQVYWYGQQDNFRAMVFELLGPSLEDLFCYCGNKFTVKTTAMLADQLIARLKSLHQECFLHRDLKPENFLLGTGRRGNTVYITDFGLSFYRDPARGVSASTSIEHEPELIGTCQYASINGHRGIPQTRADDLESLGYVLVYFAKGSLPWQGLRTSSKSNKYRQVLEAKQNTNVAQLCKGLPPAFHKYMEYMQTLADRNAPDYDYLRRLFKILLQQEKLAYDHVFDWTLLELQREIDDKTLSTEERSVKTRRNPSTKNRKRKRKGNV